MNSGRKISVLHLISSADFLGAERVVCELAACADPGRIRVQVGVLGSPAPVLAAFQAALHGSAAELFYFPCPGKFSPGALKALRAHLRAHRNDLVHAHGYKSDLYGFLATAAARCGARLVATNHTWKLRSFSERIYKALDSRVLRRLPAVAAVSSAVSDEMQSLGIAAGRISVIYNGVSIDGGEQTRAQARRVLGLDLHDLVLGCVASLTSEKAHQDLIRAFARLQGRAPRARLVLVGEGPERENLQLLVRSLGLGERVLFAGQRQDAKALYPAFDLFALVSYAEGLPMAMLEAMAASLPVVVSAVGAIPQVVHPMVHGLLTTPGDIDGIADSLALLQSDPLLRQSLGANARNRVVSNYSVQRMARDYEQLYRKVLEEAR